MTTEIEELVKVKSAIACDGCDDRHAVRYKNVNDARMAFCEECLTKEESNGDNAGLPETGTGGPATDGDRSEGD